MKDDEKTGVIPPLDSEAATHAFPFSKGALDVLCFQLFWKATEREDASDGGREAGSRSGRHILTGLVEAVEKKRAKLKAFNEAKWQKIYSN